MEYCCSPEAATERTRVLVKCNGTKRAVFPQVVGEMWSLSRKILKDFVFRIETLDFFTMFQSRDVLHSTIMKNSPYEHWIQCWKCSHSVPDPAAKLSYRHTSQLFSSLLKTTLLPLSYFRPSLGPPHLQERNQRILYCVFTSVWFDLIERLTLFIHSFIQYTFIHSFIHSFILWLCVCVCVRLCVKGGWMYLFVWVAMCLHVQWNLFITRSLGPWKLPYIRFLVILG